MLDFFLSSLLVYKYEVLFFVVVTASFGFPIPATALLMAAGAFASEGYLDIHATLLCGFFASVLGDVGGYFISFRYGRKVLVRIGFRHLLSSPGFAKLEGLFVRHVTSYVFYSRFLITNLGPAVNVLAGLAGTPFKKFILYALLGESLYVVLFCGLGYVFADQWEAVSAISSEVVIILALVVSLVVLFAVVRWRVRSAKVRALR